MLEWETQILEPAHSYSNTFFVFLSEFLEDMFPEKAPLFPKDSFSKHKQRLLVEVLGNKVWRYLFN